MTGHERAAWWLWIAFLASWYVAMAWTGKATSRGPLGQRVAYLAGFGLGFGLLFARISLRLWGEGGWVRVAASPLPPAWLRPLWPVPPAAGWALVAAELGGFAFAWWARLHLGRLWSGMLTLREGHRVVDSGPYRLDRHPNYTGFIAAAASFALTAPAVATLSGAAVLALVMVVKAGGEERLLRRELGAAAYDAYAARTPMIVPLPPRRPEERP